ncbi:MAG TPA: phospholipase D-like domain-containing protein [Vicinamibacterales bacterium]|nr:phospholipase D-like domain-containing protein [Vicinamibacterales bacterium]
MARTLIVLPDDTAKPVLEAIDAAQRSLRIKMFVFSDPALVRAVIAAKRRGVSARVLLNPHRRSGEQENAASRRALERAGVPVKDANPAFEVTHEKSMVVDDSAAFVKSFNWTAKDLSETRDYAVITTHEHDVADISDCFDADWRRHSFTPRADSHLLWSPNDGRDRVCGFIDAARDRLVVQSERIQDMLVIDALLRAARRGVKVHVMAKAPHTLKREKLVEAVGGLRILHDSGIKVRKLKGLKLHGKMLLADGVAAIVGSMNLAPGSFDTRRELAIEVRDADVIDRLQKLTHHDWKDSRPLDLSDEGLLADLESRVEDASTLLALNAKSAGRRAKHGFERFTR